MDLCPTENRGEHRPTQEEKGRCVSEVARVCLIVCVQLEWLLERMALRNLEYRDW